MKLMTLSVGFAWNIRRVTFEEPDYFISLTNKDFIKRRVFLALSVDHR